LTTERVPSAVTDAEEDGGGDEDGSARRDSDGTERRDSDGIESGDPDGTERHDSDGSERHDPDGTERRDSDGSERRDPDGARDAAGACAADRTRGRSPAEPAPFDDALVDRVAADAGLPADRLRALLAAHQSAIGTYTSVSGWLYELRRAYPRDPLVTRTGGVSYLAVEPTVWPEFAPSLGVDPEGEAFAAVRRVHDRAFRAVATHPGDGREAMVVRL
jgi:hypothetical protein